MKILKGDVVKIISGKDKGRQGEVVTSFPKKRLLTVKGLNLYRKHIKAQKGDKGGIVEKERPINIAKVALVCPNCQKTTRVGYQIDKSNTKYRLCHRCHKIIEVLSKSVPAKK